jgi:DNA invertase Pin-like site-specific DNA recombinase
MRLVAYLRVSTNGQAEEGQGLDVQRDTIKRWAQANGHRIVKTLTDPAVSGASELEGRPSLLEAMALLRERTAKGIVVYRLDRLARDLVGPRGSYTRVV